MWRTSPSKGSQNYFKSPKDSLVTTLWSQPLPMYRVTKKNTPANRAGSRENATFCGFGPSFGQKETRNPCLVVEPTHQKNVSQIGNLDQMLG